MVRVARLVDGVPVKHVRGYGVKQQRAMIAEQMRKQGLSEVYIAGEVDEPDEDDDAE